ncbi:MAG: NAD-dependent epimerase/dehydratase family protein [Marinobacter sp.]|nr:NAD-dependent epimerase/dehydratase family protein [Marinobacter sp.]
MAVAELARRLGCRLVFISGFMLENLQHLNQLGIDPAQSEKTNWRDVYRHAGAYGASKLEAALKVRSFAAQTALDMVEVQPATVAGHSQTGELDAAQPLYQLLDNLSRGRLALVSGTWHARTLAPAYHSGSSGSLDCRSSDCAECSGTLVVPGPGYSGTPDNAGVGQRLTRR